MPKSYERPPEVDVQRLKMPDQQRHMSTYRYEGQAEDVIRAVAVALEKDTHTQCYEHMRLRIGSVEPLERGQLAITTRKNNYAGD